MTPAVVSGKPIASLGGGARWDSYADRTPNMGSIFPAIAISKALSAGPGELLEGEQHSGIAEGIWLH